MKKILPAISVILCLVIAACASIGNPGGGARDEDPPRLVHASPAPWSTDVDRERITLDFDEIVNVKDAYTNVVMSPPGKSVPRVSSNGRRVTIQLPDSLEPNTTYTIDFGTSIEDNNEGNKLNGFTYTFSTGPAIDTLRVAGMVLGAQDLEPAQQMLVGLYSDLSDSAFMKRKIQYLAKTDDRGRFIVRGLPSGKYRVVALKDNDNDLKYANPEEDLAFYGQFVVPSAERTVVSDTILNLKTGEVDTIVERERTVFLPNTLLLRSFNSGKKTQYLVKYERPDSARITLLFNTAADSLPGFEIPAFRHDSRGIIAERSATNDTITYWLPPKLATIDTIRAAVTYLKPDSASIMAPATDSLNFILKRPKAPKRKEKEKKKESSDSVETVKTPVLSWTIEGNGSVQEVYKPMTVVFDKPLARLDTASFRLEQKTDTVWHPTAVPLKFVRTDSLNPRKVIFNYPWESGKSYRLLADSAAAVSLYGDVMNAISNEFVTKPIEDYATFTFRLSGLPDSIPAFVEMLNTSDTPVRKTAVSNGNAVFRFLEPGKYYARVTLDWNGDGVWTPGDFISGTAPDEAFYYPKVLNIKKNWDYNQEWDIWATPVDLQKPEAVKKNKPEADRRNRKKKTDDEDEEDDIDDDPFGSGTGFTDRRNNRTGNRR